MKWNEWLSEVMVGCMNEQMNNCMTSMTWTNGWMNEWMHELITEWINSMPWMNVCNERHDWFI